MSQQQDPDLPGEEESDGAERKRRANPFEKLGVSPAQVVGAGLAAATAAVLGGQLGLAGTVSGAALTSVIITLGGAVYQRSLESTREKAANAALKRAARRRAAQRAANAGWADPHAPTEPMRRRPGTRAGGVGTGAAGGSPTVERPDAEATRRLVAPDTTRRIRPAGTGGSPQEPTSVIGGATAAAGTAANGNSVTNGEEPSERSGRRRLNWRVVALTSGLAFVLCMVLITGYESITGNSVSGDSGGTTVGSLFRQGDAGAQQSPSDDGERVHAPESSSAPESSESPEESDTSTAPSETSAPSESGDQRSSRTPSSTAPPTSETTTETPETSSGDPAPSERPRRTVRPSDPVG